MLNLPVPKANYHNIVLKPSEQQKEMVAALGERAERVRNRMVDSTVDNISASGMLWRIRLSSICRKK